MYIGSKSLIRENIAELAKKRDLWITNNNGYYSTAFTDENWDILAEVIRTTTSLKDLAFRTGTAIALQNKKVIDALANNRTINELSLCAAHGGDEMAKAVATILKENSTIDFVRLGHNDIGVEGAKAIADALKVNKTLLHIDLSSNGIGVEGTKAIADALKVNKTLLHIDLSSNGIGVEGTKAIADALKVNKTLLHIDLSSNGIGVEGAKAIAEALKENPPLRKLYIGWNNTGDQGATSIAEALKENTSLQVISLNRNRIGVEGAKAISEALKENPPLRELYIGWNNTGDQGATSIAEALQENASLQLLYINSNKIGEEGGKHILKALQQIQRSAIENIYLHWGNQISGDTIAKIDKEIARIRINTSRTKIKEQLSTIAQLQGKITEQDKDLASMKDNMKKIGEMVIGRHGGTTTSNGSNDSMPDRETEMQSKIERYKEEIDSLKEQLKNSRPIDTVDLTNEVEPASSSGGEYSNEEEPPSKRRRTKSNLAVALEQTRQMVEVKEEAKERAAVAEANVAVARREKDAVEASLRDVQEDLEDSNELVTQQTLTTDIWQGRFDELFELARAAGVDGNRLSEIRYRPLSSGH